MNIDTQEIGTVGHDLARPECVLCLESGDIFCCHLGAGVMRIFPDGRQEAIGTFTEVEGSPWIPNGIALLPDRAFLVANMGDDGGIWRLDVNGSLIPFLREVDGEQLGRTNFVYIDKWNRTWITVTTRREAVEQAFRPGVADGYVVLLDSRGPRIVADQVAFANEVRVDSVGAHLYLVETMRRQITRFQILPDGNLGERETFVEFGYGTFPDGIAFDAEGHLWVTSVVTNRLLRVSPHGKSEIVLEDSNPEHTAKIERDIATGTLIRSDIQKAVGKTMKNLSSLAFGGPSLSTIYLGSLGGTALPCFDVSVPGDKPVHWQYRI